jgi:hypothetical protein
MLLLSAGLLTFVMVSRPKLITTMCSVEFKLIVNHPATERSMFIEFGFFLIVLPNKLGNFKPAFFFLFISGLLLRHVESVFSHQSALLITLRPIIVSKKLLSFSLPR